MRMVRRVSLAVLTVILLPALAFDAGAQDRARTKEIVVGLGAEPRTMLGVNLLGDWLRDTLDPKLRV